MHHRVLRTLFRSSHGDRARARLFLSALACAILSLPGSASGQVVADRSAGADVEGMRTAWVPRPVVDRALRRGQASPAAFARVVGQPDSVEFRLEKPRRKLGRPGDRRPAWVPGDDRSHTALPSPGNEPGTDGVPARTDPSTRIDQPSWVATFDGPGYTDVAVENGSYIIPADPSVAAGPEHVVAVVNTSIVAWSKSGSQVLRQPFSAFFAPLAPSGTLFDPKVRYSTFDGRFVVVLLELTDAGQGAPGNVSNLLVGVSQTADPAAGWVLSRVDVRTSISGISYWADFPGLAVDDDHAYVTANLFAFGTGTYGGTRVWVLPMDELAAGAPGPSVPLDPFALASVPDLSSTLQPAVVHGKLPGDPTATWLVEFSGLNDAVSSYVGLFRLLDPLGSPSVELSFLELGTVDDFNSSLPGAPQAGSATTVATNDRRTLDSAWRRDRLAASFTLVPPGGPDGGQATAAWFEADVSSPGAPSLLVFGTEGAEELAPGTHTYFPSVDLGADGSLALGFSASSAGAFVGAFASLGPAGEPAGSLRPPLALHSGTAAYVRTFGSGSNRWGDYSGVASDPTGDGSFWVFNKFADSRGDLLLGEDGRWGTRIGRLALVDVAADPVATDDTYEALEDEPLFVSAPGVLANDTDEDSPLLTAGLLTTAAFGSLTLHPDGSFEYAPEPDFSGTDGFAYTVSDESGRSDTGSVSIAVLGVNDAPVAATDAYDTVEDTALEVPAPGVLANDSDVDSPGLTVQVVTGPTHGRLVLDPDGGFRYDPDREFSGVDGFRYVVGDGVGGTDAADVVLTVTAVNDLPSAVDDEYDVPEDSQLVVAAPGVLGNDSDVDSSTLVASAVTAPLHGIATLLPDGSLTYVPFADFWGEDRFTYEVRDEDGSWALAGVTIRVDPVNDAPVATDDRWVTTEDTPLAVPPPGFLANDADVDSPRLSAELLVGPSNGVLSFSPHGSFYYVPTVDFSGLDGFTYRVRDEAGGDDIAAVILEVRAADDPPVASPDAWTTPEDTPLVVPAPGVLGNDIDPDSPSLAAEMREGPRQGSLSLAPDGSFRYEPEPDTWGTDGFTYAVIDGSGGVATASVTLTVSAVNDPPRATAAAIEVPAGGVVTATLDATDPDGDPLVFTIAVPPTRGTVVLAGNAATYSPEAGFAGADLFRYAVTDPGGLTDVSGIAISVRGTAFAQVVHLPQETGPTIDVRFGQEDLARDLRPGQAGEFTAVTSGVARLRVSDASSGAALWDEEITLDHGTWQHLVALRAPDGGFAVHGLAEARADHALPGILLRTTHLLPGRRVTILREADTPDHAVVDELARDLLPYSPTPYSGISDAGHNLRVTVEGDPGPGVRREETVRFDFSGHGGRSVALFVHPVRESDGFGLRAVTSAGDVLLPVVVTAAEEEMPRGIAVSAVYPNPAVDAVRLSVESVRPGRVWVDVFDLLGRRVLRIEPILHGTGREELLVDARTLPSGVYVARITQEESDRGPGRFAVADHRFVIVR